MAVVTVTTKMSAGINYTVTTSGTTDWSGVTNSTYFYDLVDKLPHYKDSTGNILEVFSSSGSSSTSSTTFTGGTVSGATIFTGGLTGTSIYNGYLDFNTGATVTAQVGRLNWNDADEVGGLEVTMKGGNVTLQIGEENLARVYNADSVTLTDGMLVYAFGSQGNTISVKRATNSGETQSSRIIGMVTESIPVGSRGFVNTYGLINTLNTSAYSGGTTLYLDSVLGGYTNVKPIAPNHVTVIGYVSRSNAVNGSIFLSFNNGWTLDELHDARITGATFGDVLTYSAYNGTNLWVNSKTLNGAYTMTGLTVNGNTTVTNGLVRVQGNSSNELVRITQLGSGNAFLVEDSTNPDASPFVITASGDTGIGLLTPLNGDKLTVSGNTTVYGTLIGTTISATTYQGLPTDIYVTGGTYSEGTAVFTNSSGGTFSVSGFSTGSTSSSSFTGGTVAGATIFTGGLSANTISATTTYFDRILINTGATMTPSNPERLLVNDGGTGGTSFSNIIVGITNVNSYAQLNIINDYAGTNASTDIVATSDAGTESSKYIDMGINSSVFTGSTSDGSKANDAYLFSTGNDLWIGNASVNRYVMIHTDGQTSGNTRIEISSGTTKIKNTFVITSTPVNNNGNSQILTRNSITGNIEYSDISALASGVTGTFSYGLAYAMSNQNYLM